MGHHTQLGEAFKIKSGPVVVSQLVIEMSGLDKCSFSLLCDWIYLSVRKRRNISRKPVYFCSTSFLRSEVSSCVPTLICFARQDQNGHGLNLSFTRGKKKLQFKS